MPSDKPTSECKITSVEEQSASESVFAEASSLIGGIGRTVVDGAWEFGQDIVDHFKLNPQRAIPELLVPPLLIYDAMTSYDLDNQ